MDDKDLQKTITGIARKAKSLALQGAFESAIAEYTQGLELLAEPKHASEYAVMLFSGIAEAYYLQGLWDDALKYFGEAIRSEGGLGDPYIHLRLGQIRYRKGEMEKAADELMRAYMGSGKIIFEGEDPMYYALIRSHIE